MAGRVRGSCRFAPYFKIQRWNAAALAWKDVQRSHATAQEARNAAPSGRFRLVTVTEDGRTCGDPEERPG
jgi:hypothetical protein